MKASVFAMIVVSMAALILSNSALACSPILLDLDQDGFKLGEPGVGVYFDMDCDGGLEHLQWVAPGQDDAFLAFDKNGNGIVDDGSELFGVGTPLELNGEKATHGYQALKQFDRRILGGNGDGVIDPDDGVWEGLSLWTDANADGISDQSEMRPLSDSNILSLDLDARRSQRRDAAGNWYALWSWATVDGQPKRMRMVDIFFAVLPE
jgi:hypothetical protein